MTFQIRHPTRKIILHSKNLIIDDKLIITYHSAHKTQPLTSASQVINETESNIETKNTDEITSDNKTNTKNTNKELPEEEDKLNAITNDNINEPAKNVTANASESKETDKTISNIEIPADKPKENVSTPSPPSTENENIHSSSELPSTSTSSSVSTPEKEPSSIKTSSTTAVPVSERIMPDISTTSTPATTPADVPVGLNIVGSTFSIENYKLKINAAGSLQTGVDYTISISFKGTMSDRYGLIKAEYLNDETKNKR